MRKLASLGADLGAEFVEMRYERAQGVTVLAEDEVVRVLSYGESEGFGIRAFFKGAWGFSSTQRLDLLEESLRNAVKLAKLSSKMKKDVFEMRGCYLVGHSKLYAKIDLEDVSMEEKAKLVLEAQRAGRKLDRIKSITTRYSDEKVHKEVVNNFGVETSLDTSRVSFMTRSYASEGGITERAMETATGTGGYEIVLEGDPLGKAEEASRRAIDLLSARSAPSGKFKAILDPKLGGVFIHEAFGHASEADLVLAGMSLLEGKVGQKIGAELVQVIDDPTVDGLFGSYSFDDEGMPARRKVIVEGGVLKGFMHNLESSSRMNCESTGNGRTCSYDAPPIVRMSNTFIDRGDSSLDEMLSEMRRGIYALGSLYGYTNPAKGQFMFKAEEGWLVEKAELKQRLREVALSGDILSMLMNVELVGKDLSFQGGYCGKDGQTVPVSIGSPHVLVREVVFGGMG